MATKAKSKTTADPEETPRQSARRREILDAAVELFYERGFDRVGVNEIGAKIGISGPALYRHFEGKDEILARLFEEAMEEIIAGYERSDDPRTELESLIENQARFAVGHHKLLSIYTHEERALVAPHRSRFRRRMRDHARHWEQALARCYPKADEAEIAAAAQAAIGMIHSVVYWPANARSAPRLVELLRRLVLGGLEELG